MMKKSILNIMLSILLVGFSLTSCDTQKEEAITEGNLVFVVDQAFNNARISADLEPTYVLVSISNTEGTSVFNSTKLALNSFEGKLQSEGLSLLNGSYFLDEYHVINASNEVIYSTPKSDAELAYLVKKPLSIELNISENEVTSLQPEVISTEGHEAVDFGYATFSFNIVDVFSFGIEVKDIDTDELITSQVNIKNDNSANSFELEAEVSKISLKNDGENFTFSVIKEGYYSSNFSIPKEELEQYSIDNPIIVSLEVYGNSLLAHFPFNNSLKDISGNDYHGTHSLGIPNYVVDYHNNAANALTLDNKDQYINVPAITDFSSNEIAVAVWIKPKEFYSKSCQLNMIIGNRVSGNGLWYLGYGDNFADGSDCGNYDPENTPFGFRIAFDDGSSSFDKSETLISLDEWYFVVAQYNGTHLNIYVNGELETEVEYNKTLVVNDTDIVIGRSIYDSNFPYNMNGDLDDIKIFNRALTLEQIQALYLEKVNL